MIRDPNHDKNLTIMSRGGSRGVAKCLQESILITFDLIWKVLLS